MNCNPMTKGHAYLIEQAAKQCDTLYLFIVSEDKSAVPAQDRRRIVEDATAHLGNVHVVQTGRYLISSATFPDYFIKDKSRSGEAWTQLDIAVFCRAAQALGITKRFVGTEPFCPTTNAYNDEMARSLPQAGVDFVQLPRFEQDGTAISATAVRALIAEGRWQETEKLVPAATWRYISEAENREKILARMKD
jgi:[citrate (pro-3S)-lyase] ligase